MMSDEKLCARGRQEDNLCMYGTRTVLTHPARPTIRAAINKTEASVRAHFLTKGRYC
jgi:hypothetical protein